MDKDGQDKLLSQVAYLERASARLEMNGAEREEAWQKVKGYTEQFLNSLATAKAYEKNGYDRTKQDDQFNIGNETASLPQTLTLLEQRVDATGLNPPSGGHLGYIPAGGLYLSALADYIAAITNRYAGVFYASPGAVRIENAVVKWTGELVGYKENFGGNLTSGGSFANLIAIATARYAHRIRPKEVERSVVYICRQAHHSILKALRICGLDESIMRIIDLDEYYRMDVQKLRTQVIEDVAAGLKPFILFANAGSTDAGAVDDLEEMAAVAKAHGLWLHVDAAYGGFFLLTESGRDKLKGIELADSVIMDPHKGMFIPYGLGIVLVKNVQHLLGANHFDANYMEDTLQQNQEYSPSQLSPELSKHFRGLRMWLPLKLLGSKPFAASLDEKLLLAQYFYEQVKTLGFATGPFPDLSIVMFWYQPASGDANEYNRRLLNYLQKDGRIFISATYISGKMYLRFVALSFRTHLAQTDLLLSLLKNFVEKEIV